MKLKIIILCFVICLCSCEEKVKYPNYSLTTIEYVPDSLKIKHRTWITETVRAASQHMTGGDYEDVDQTIIQSKWTADDLFQVKEIGLRKKISNNFYDDVEILQKDMTANEKSIFHQLVNSR